MYILTRNHLAAPGVWLLGVSDRSSAITAASDIIGRHLAPAGHVVHETEELRGANGLALASWTSAEESWLVWEL